MDPSRYVDGVYNLYGPTGFLPKHQPLERLPEVFSAVQRLLDGLPIKLPNGHPGLLATSDGLLRPVETLADLSAHVETLDPDEDGRLVQALFRSYAFLASAYLLAPSHHAQKSRPGDYGEARRRLPAQLSRPLVAAADKLGIFPWLEYHHGFALGNYAFVDPSRKEASQLYHWTNLRMCNTFTGGADEIGFTMLHVHINGVAGNLVGSIVDALNAAQNINGVGNVGRLRHALRRTLAIVTEMNEVRRLMWRASRPRGYNDFRVFIMGIKDNEAIFGDEGVVFEGVDRFEGKAQRYRGETGAQDDLIPTLDIFTGVIDFYPENKLTAYLMDLRQYRPPVVQSFFQDLREAVNRQVRLRDVIKKDVESLALMAAIVEQIYLFRNGHWQFVQRYIMAQTKYGRATGGTPITSFLPNQIASCLKLIHSLTSDAMERMGGLGEDEETRQMVHRVEGAQRKREQILNSQLAELSKEAFDANLVFRMNDGAYDHNDAVIVD